jgi:hypothetical protein
MRVINDVVIGFLIDKEVRKSLTTSATGGVRKQSTMSASARTAQTTAATNTTSV